MFTLFFSFDKKRLWCIRLWRVKQDRYYNRRIFTLALWEAELLKKSERFRIVKWS